MELKYKYGVEIEITERKADGSPIERSEIARAINSKGVAAEVQGYNHNTQNVWKVITDSSCGFEIVSPILEGQDGLNQLKKVTEALNEVGAQVNINCGLHVHIDGRDLTKQQIGRVVLWYAKWEKAIDAMLPASRRANSNRYCQSLDYVVKPLSDALWQNNHRIKFWSNPVGWVDGVNGRYSKVNLNSYIRYGSIEFRQHSGTTEFEKISNWIMLLQRFVARAIETTPAYKPLTPVLMKNFRVWLGFNRNSSGAAKRLADYTFMRFKHFNPNLTVNSAL